MIIFIFQVIVAVAINCLTYSWKWWSVSILFPIFMSFSNFIYKQDIPMPLSNQRLMIDSSITIISIGYLISQVFIYNINIDKWYSWLIGLIVGWIGMELIAPRRWQYED